LPFGLVSRYFSDSRTLADDFSSYEARQFRHRGGGVPLAIGVIYPETASIQATAGAGTVNVLCRAPISGRLQGVAKPVRKITARMSDQYGTTDLIQGKVLAALPWEGGCKTEAIARYASLDEDTARRALEDLVRRRMVMIDDRNYWRKKPLD
jgi:hypothetical protein